MDQDNVWGLSTFLIKRTVPDDVDKLDKRAIQKILAEWINNMLPKTSQSDKQIVANIKSLPDVLLEVPKWMTERFKEALHLYVIGLWHSSAMTIGIISVYLTFYLIEKHTKMEGIESIIEYSGDLARQLNRLNLLKKLQKLSETEYEHLKEVNNIRNSFVHLKILKLPDNEIKAKNLEIITHILSVFQTIKIDYKQLTMELADTVKGIKSTMEVRKMKP